MDVTADSASQLVSLADIEAARSIIAGAINRTPLLTSRTAARLLQAAHGLRIADGRLYLKAEHLQRTGSFKPRGMTARVAALTEEQRRRGIITFSAGNAAQGYAYAGSALGVPVTVVMPAAANPTKVAATKGYGAEVVLEGAHFGEVVAAMERIRDERGLTLCHPFDDAEVIAGHGSAGLEILDDLPDVEVVVVAIGGGGLISGVATAIRERRPAVRVYGVEPVGSDAMSRALAAGAPEQFVPSSVADGLNAPFAGERTLRTVQRYVEDVIRLEEATILMGLRFGLERLKQVLEPAGAAALAAVLANRIPIRDGERVAVVLSGGNLDLTRAGELLAAADPLPA
ncbi:MAG TPA: threonine/serine dehydratase [Candidatus Limnocylindrales bacterium]